MIKTPQTHPNHPVVGHFFDYDNKILYCDSYDTSCGFWMTEYKNPSYRVNVSERAIDRTIHTIHVMGDGSAYSNHREYIKPEDVPTREEHEKAS